MVQQTADKAPDIKKILILAANPTDRVHLKLDIEIREIDEGLRRAKYRDCFDIRQRSALRIEDLRRALLDEEPHIVHFSGHGEQQGVFLEDDDGKAVQVNSAALSELFDILADGIECVVFNCCYSEKQAQATSQHVNHVVGMRQEIGIEASREFSIGFYDGIGAGKTVEQAFKLGCNAINLKNLPEHLTPVLLKNPNVRINEQKSEQDLPVSTTGILNLPFNRNPNFTGREEELEQLEQNLKDLGQAVLFGLGGSGKTQIGLEYIYRQAENYDHIFWITADNKSDIDSGFQKIADQLNLSQKRSEDIKIVVEAVKYWLMTNERWVLVFDNADDPNIVSTFLPRKISGHIIFTSRSPNWRFLGKKTTIEVDKMPVEDAIYFLLRSLDLESPTAEETNAAKELAEELGYLALALEQAAAYISELETTIQKYLVTYRNLGLDLLESGASDIDPNRETVAKTWQLNFDKVREISQAASELLQVCSILAAAPIPLVLFEKGHEFFRESLSKELIKLAKNPLAMDQILSPLRSYSLIRKDGEQLTVHPLVQEVVLTQMENSEREWLLNNLAKLLDDILPQGNIENWPTWKPIAAHVAAVSHKTIKYDLVSEEVVKLLIKEGYYRRKVGANNEAVRLFEHVLRIRQQLGREEDLNNTFLMGQLAHVYLNLDRIEEARTYFDKVLDIRQREHGLMHIDTAEALSDKAHYYSYMNQYETAEGLAKQALEIYKELEIEEHPSAISCLEIIYRIKSELNKLDEAEQDCLKVLNFRKNVFGEYDAETANTHIGLAWIYKLQSKMMEAEYHFTKGLEIHELVLGKEHLRTAHDLKNLATFYSEIEQFEKAESFFEEALTIYNKCLDPEHSAIGKLLNNYGINFLRQGKYVKAKEMFQKSLVLKENTLGPDHPATIRSRRNVEKANNKIVTPK